jgi:site-specific recombinase XerD
MAKLKGYDNVTSFTKNGKLRYRWRSGGHGGGKAVMLPGNPGEPEFENTYRKCIKGEVPTEKARITNILDAKTVNACYRRLLRTSAWDAYDPATRDKNSRMLLDFMATKVTDDMDVKWADVLMADIKTKHLRKLLETVRLKAPTKAKHMLVAIRKLTKIAIEQEWIEYDPTFTFEAPVPKTLGHRKWPDAMIARFRAFHPIGSAARTCFELALWLGNRRSDIARLTWEMLIADAVEMANGEEREMIAFSFRQKKNSKRTGGKEMFLPVRKDLAEALEPLDRDSGFVLLNGYGKPFSEKSLTGMMQHWCRQADIPVASRKEGTTGYTLHGLRKNYGIKLALDGATGPQIMNAMGHSSLREADPYLQEANRKKLVADAFISGERLDETRQATKRRAAYKVVGGTEK